jgi:hypothetical protein
VKFPYYKFPNKDPNKKSIERPCIKATINYNSASVSLIVLVDSGADYCVMDKDIADFLELDLQDGELDVTGGLGGKGTKVYYFDNIYINIGGVEVKTKCGFVDGKVVGGQIAGVLGRQGFFEKFKVTIDETKKEIELKEKS